MISIHHDTGYIMERLMFNTTDHSSTIYLLNVAAFAESIVGNNFSPLLAISAT